MFKKLTLLIAVLLALAVFSACSITEINTGNNGSKSTETVTPSGKKEETSMTVLTDPADESMETDSDFTLTPSEGSAAVTVNGNVYTITGAGEYVASGKLANGSIVVNAGDEDEVKIIFSNASVTCDSGAPVLALNAGKVIVNAEEDSYNVITDSRTGSADADSESEENYDAAIYACCDLTIAGKGTLIVNGNYDNGIKTKDDLTVKNLSLKVTAKGNALKGNDSVTIKSGSLILISTGSDGIKTENSGVSAKGNQKGNVVIEGGHVDLYAACDGISAACGVEISETETETVVNIFTSSYSDSAGEVSASTELYLILPSSAYSSSNDYYGYFYSDTSESSEYVKFTYETMVRSGRTSYYGLVGKVSGTYSKVMFLKVSSGAEPSTDSALLKSSGDAINTSMNAYLVSGKSTLDGDWVSLSKDSNGSGKTAYSSKGIKAADSVLISGGTVTIKCMDDGIHANADGTLENGSKAAGSVTISGGTVTITAADDGIHADGRLTISGGLVNVEEAHEGLEGNVVAIEGGETYVYGKDDGINACKGSASTPMVLISGGYLEVRTPSGDTDAIDSNGSIEMTGGTVLVMGGSSSGAVAGSVDVERTLTVTGGTILAFGGICETPDSGSVNTYISSGTFSAGDYVLSEKNGSEILRFTLTGSYSSVWISSDQFELNGSYTLSNANETLLSWTQTSQSVGSSGFGGGGFGGGGFGPGRR